MYYLKFVFSHFGYGCENEMECACFCPFRLYCSMIGSTDDDILLLEELDDDIHVYIRHTKDFHFVTVNRFSPTSSKVCMTSEELHSRYLC